MQLYNNAGITRDGFVGVPLFQAEGLTVKGDSGRYTPLFFSKDDLDIALRDTFVNQNESEKKDLEAKIQRARQELTDLETSIKGEAHGKSRRKMEKSISETRKRLEDYKKRQKEENRNKVRACHAANIKKSFTDRVQHERAIGHVQDPVDMVFGLVLVSLHTL